MGGYFYESVLADLGEGSFALIVEKRKGEVRSKNRSKLEPDIAIVGFPLFNFNQLTKPNLASNSIHICLTSASVKE